MLRICPGREIFFCILFCLFFFLKCVLNFEKSPWNNSRCIVATINWIINLIHVLHFKFVFFKQGSVCARSWGGHEQRGGRETLVGEACRGSQPWVPQPRCVSSRERGERGWGCMFEPWPGDEMQVAVNTAAWAVMSSGGSVRWGIVKGSCGVYKQDLGVSHPLGWPKPPLLLFEISRGMHGRPVPATTAIGVDQGWTCSTRGPKASSALGCPMFPNPLKPQPGQAGPLCLHVPCQTTPYLLWSCASAGACLTASSLKTSVTSLLCTVCRALDACAATQAGQPSLDAIIVPWYGAPPGDTAPAGLHARPVGGSGSVPEC